MYDCDGGELEVIDGDPEGAAIPSLPDAPQAFSPGLDAELKKLTQQVRQ
jgi:Mn-containing catalase